MSYFVKRVEAAPLTPEETKAQTAELDRAIAELASGKAAQVVLNSAMRLLLTVVSTFPRSVAEEIARDFVKNVDTVKSDHGRTVQ